MYASDLLFCVSKTRLRKRRPFGGAVLSLSFSLLLLHHDHDHRHRPYHLMHTGPETCVTRVLPGDMLAAAAQTGMKFLRGVLIGCILATTPALL